MTEEFNLSNFVENDDDIEDGKVGTMFVKEFIKKLKEELYPFEDEHGQIANPIIDKLAGDKLT
jgi:hypothetical protein